MRNNHTTQIPCFFQTGGPGSQKPRSQQVMLDDHSKVDPLLPFPNRTVKRLRADDSGWTSVKVGHRQAFIPKTPARYIPRGGCFMTQSENNATRYESGLAQVLLCLADEASPGHFDALRI